MKTHILVFPLSLLALGIAGCNSDKKPERISRPELPDEVRPVAEAISNDSPEEFAATLNYPIERPYPLKNVEDSSQMVKYFPNLVDEPLKRAVKEQPDSAWRQEGWRGWTLDNGAYFWIDSGKIYEISYLSKKETSMRDSLQQLEIASLAPALQKDWVPVACVVDTVSGAIFRIDSTNGTDSLQYRLAGYSKDSDLSGNPTIILYGTLELEGSMGNRYYYFSDDSGTTALYSPDITDDVTTPEIEIDRNGKAKKYGAKPAYWLDHIHKHPHKPQHK